MGRIKADTKNMTLVFGKHLKFYAFIVFMGLDRRPAVLNTFSSFS